MNPLRPAFWTAERIERVKALLADGCSASMIARDLGAESRNSVCSIIHRKGLRTGVPAPKQPRAPRPPREPRAVIVRPQAPPKPLPPREPVLTGNEPSLTSLTRLDCRFPVGEATGREQRFCGQPVCDDGGRPYCDRHRGKTTVASRPLQQTISRRMGQRAPLATWR